MAVHCSFQPAMSSDHARAKALFLEALTRPAGARTAFLAEACGDDLVLRREVGSLLAFHADEHSVAPEVPALAPSPASSRAPFVPGAVFAGRYRMVTRIGRGGMGDVWRADDLVLDTPVALKLIHSTSAEARSAILNEVRLARRITHPAVCRVFDVGEAEDEVFFSMELVNGEDLATLIRRVGRLPSERVIELALELCAGLAAAHAQGVLHRDLKPANLLIDADGAARITDFGIAIAHADEGRHSFAGTPDYMAPEQLSLGAPLSERTDLYALGLVLYELVVGSRPRRSATGTFPAPSALVPDVSPQLERIILQALAIDPADRPASALAMAASLADEARRPFATRSWLAGAAVAALVVMLAAGSPFVIDRGAGALTESDTIVLADFTNSTGEPVFDGTLKVALTIALEQSPFLKVFPEDRVRQTLRLMEREPTERVTRAVAREIAQRERLKALLAGSIARLGRNYVLALEAVNAETGDVMAREQVEVAGAEEVLTGLGTAATNLREKLGESLSSIQRFDVPVAEATTASLEALRAYTLALDEGRVMPRVEAIPHVKRALELDPDFALAHAMLSAIYANTGQSALAPPFARRAFELRDRVSERERFFISWRYYRDATQAWDKALELARAWTKSYPREAFAFNSLGIAYAQLGQIEQAAVAYGEATRLDPRFVPPYGNLIAVLVALNRPDEAHQVVRQAEAAQIQSSGVKRMSHLIGFINHDDAAMKASLDAVLATPQAVEAFNWQARIDAFGGRMSAANAEFRRAAEAAVRDGFKERAATFSTEAAEAHAVMGQCAEARASAAEGLALSRDNFSVDRANRSLALCGAGAEVTTLSRDLASAFPESTVVRRVSLPVASAALAIQRGEFARGLDILEPVRPYDRAPGSDYWPAYLRGVAYLHVKDGPKAATEFQAIVGQRGLKADSPLYPLAHLGLARAANLSGELARARAAYDAFLAFWKNADTTLQPLIEARRERARLR